MYLITIYSSKQNKLEDEEMQREKVDLYRLYTQLTENEEQQ